MSINNSTTQQESIFVNKHWSQNLCLPINRNPRRLTFYLCSSEHGLETDHFFAEFSYVVSDVLGSVPVVDVPGGRGTSHRLVQLLLE